MHLNVETLDKVALEQRFGEFEDPQHLYEGAYGADVSPGSASLFEVDEGDDEDRSDLEALIAATAGSGLFGERLAPVADLDQMIRMWAVEKYVGHWDGYSGREYVNNYYLYSDPTGVFQMLPWGTDQTWGLPNLPFGPPGGLLFEQCLDEATCEAAYRQALGAAQAAIESLDLSARATQIAALLAPWQELEEPPRKPFDAVQIEAAVEATRDFIAARPAWLATYLAPPLPPVEKEPLLLAVSGSPSGPAGSRLSSRLDVDRSRLARGLLLMRLDLASPGAVSQRALIVIPDGVHRACATRARVDTAGTLALRCRLSSFARRRLDRAALKLRVEVEFQADSGQAESLARFVTLPRQAYAG